MQQPGEVATPAEERVTVCPRCHCHCTARYESEVGLVCGFCAGVGPDGRLTGRHGRLPAGWPASSEET